MKAKINTKMIFKVPENKKPTERKFKETSPIQKPIILKDGETAAKLRAFIEEIEKNSIDSIYGMSTYIEPATLPRESCRKPVVDEFLFNTPIESYRNPVVGDFLFNTPRESYRNPVAGEFLLNFPIESYSTSHISHSCSDTDEEELSAGRLFSFTQTYHNEAQRKNSKGSAHSINI